MGFETLVTYISSVRVSGYYGLAAVPALALSVVSSPSTVAALSQEE
ncbi:hypothetical protein ACFQGT_20335 [Natrialbaceae archaeon GCM10025810]